MAFDIDYLARMYEQLEAMALFYRLAGAGILWAGVGVGLWGLGRVVGEVVQMVLEIDAHRRGRQ